MTREWPLRGGRGSVEWPGRGSSPNYPPTTADEFPLVRAVGVKDMLIPDGRNMRFARVGGGWKDFLIQRAKEGGGKE